MVAGADFVTRSSPGAIQVSQIDLPLPAKQIGHFHGALNCVKVSWGGQDGGSRCNVGRAAESGPAAESGDAAGSDVANLEGGAGGPLPPDVDGGHHFRPKMVLQVKVQYFAPRNARAGGRLSGFIFGLALLKSVFEKCPICFAGRDRQKVFFGILHRAQPLKNQ